MKVETVPLAALAAYEGNPKTHPADQIELIKRSIAEFGWTVPLLVDEANVLIAGHGRYEAAAQLGLTEAPVIRLENLTEAQIRAYRIADNRITEMGGWDRLALATELEFLRDLDFDFDLTGFDLDFLSALSVDEAAVTRGEQPEPWLEENPVIATATANELPTAIIRFRTDEARADFDAWLGTIDHSITRKPRADSIYMPAKEPERFNRE